MRFKLILLTGLLFFGISKIEAQQQPVTITVLYDNYQFSDSTISDFGFACLIIRENDTILFDTGSQKDILFHNLNALNVDLSTIQTLVISHHHGDHVGNIFPLIEANPDIQVFLPSTLDGNFRGMVESYKVRTEIERNFREIAYQVFITGEMGFQIPEQSIVIKTEKGLVLISACGHPGIDRMVRKVSRKFDEKVYMVIGGFHLEDYSDKEIDAITETFREFGVEKIAPGHCTGQQAMDRFRQTWHHNFIRSGTGKVFEF
ncbi:MAG: MBL fold metallo-hydrolase [Bacteroidales bacterium]|nr:MBL fold metallo-hydrolase [Bacteroidales bacterium]